jgi:phosphomannomutase
LDEGDEVNRIFRDGNPEYVISKQLGTVEEFTGGADEHIKRILEHPLVDISSIRRRQFRVAVDGINSVGNLIIPDLLHELGCDVVKINDDLSGEFTRGAEPLPENLADLCELVVDEGADFGIALDPDGDRLAIVNEEGNPIGEEYTLALVTKYVLSIKPGPVVINLSTTRAIEDIAVAASVPCFRTPVGEAHVAAEMDKQNAVIGGEGNGGVMLADIHAGRDAMVGTSLILALLASEGSPMSVIHSRLPQYEMVKRKTPVEGFNINDLESLLYNAFGETASYDTQDGVRVDIDEGWVHIRSSNTEPIVRIFAEAKTISVANQLADRATEALAGG